MKYCNKCGQTKPVNEFYVQKQKDGSTRLSGYCRKCMRDHYLTPRRDAKAAKRREERYKANGLISIADLPGEIWKAVVGYEDCYEVSNLGRVKSFFKNHSKLKKPYINPKLGYPAVSISFCEEGKRQSKTFYVHRLLAEAFIPNPNNYPDVNHIDGNKANNHYTNLEWCTPKMNTQHSIHVLKNHPAYTRALQPSNNVTATQKICVCCNTWKDHSEFYKSKKSSHGLFSYCKVCQRAKANSLNKKKLTKETKHEI